MEEGAKANRCGSEPHPLYDAMGWPSQGEFAKDVRITRQLFDAN